jgi:acyl-CoA synthetase (AMP-forming)/AMP-acid ligase II
MYLEDYAADRPAEIGLRDSHSALTWSGVDKTVNQLVNALDSTELGPRRRVAVFATNSAEVILTHLGILHAEAAAVAINSHLTSREVAQVLRDSGAAALFVGSATAERGLKAARSSGVDKVVVWGGQTRPIPDPPLESR